MNDLLGMICGSEPCTYFLDRDDLEVRKYIKTDINKLKCGAELNYLVHVETPVDVRLFYVGDVGL
jgi:hypothetical protein